MERLRSSSEFHEGRAERVEKGVYLRSTGTRVAPVPYLESDTSESRQIYFVERCVRAGLSAVRRTSRNAHLD